MRAFLLRLAPLVLILLSSLPLAAPARANVDLAYFEVVTSTSATQLIVRWGTETETDTAGFRIKRATVADVAQALDIRTEPARGSSISGADYEFTDTGLTTGQVYHYWLVELTTGGQQEVLRTVTATPGGESATATPTTQSTTATPTTQSATATPTATQRPPTATPTQPPAASAANTVAPTATRPPAATQPAATATPQPALAPTSAPISTPAPVAATSNTSPAEPLPVEDAQADEAAAATAIAAESAERGEDAEANPPALPADALPAPVDGATSGEQDNPVPELDAAATPQVVAQADQPPLDAPQAQLLRPTATPRPDSATGSDNTNDLLLVIGGGSLCGAALLVLVVLFVWRRR